MTFALVTQALTAWFVYFQIEPEGLLCRHLWKTRFFRWEELTRVGNSVSSVPWMRSLEVYYLRKAPELKTGRLLIVPRNRETLIEVLREHAPRAEFDV
jgi:hypothetical protein